MKALILDNNVVEVKNEEFPVSPPLFWVDCPNGCVAGWVYDPQSGDVHEKVIPPPTIDEMKEKYKECMKNYLGMTSGERDYSNPSTLITYMHSNNETWKLEATKFVNFRDLCWEYLFQIYSEIDSGIISPPSVEEFMLNAPKMNWEVG